MSPTSHTVLPLRHIRATHQDRCKDAEERLQRMTIIAVKLLDEVSVLGAV
jgi:hypothetical protein